MIVVLGRHVHEQIGIAPFSIRLHVDKKMCRFLLIRKMHNRMKVSKTFLKAGWDDFYIIYKGYFFERSAKLFFCQLLVLFYGEVLF